MVEGLVVMHQKLYDTSSEYKSAFGSFEDFQSFVTSMVENGDELLAKRQSIYDAHGKEAIAKLDDLLKSIPELNPEDPKPFVKDVKIQEKALIDVSTRLNELVKAIERDFQEFGCEASMVCSAVKDTCLICLD